MGRMSDPTLPSGFQDEISEQEKTNAQQSLTNLLWDGEQVLPGN